MWRNQTSFAILPSCIISAKTKDELITVKGKLAFRFH